MIKTDVLIIGSGTAGLSLALRLADNHKVLLISKTSLDLTNSRMAQGGIASVYSKDDSFEKHIEDTMTAGGGISDREAVKEIITEGPQAIKDLSNWGVQFDKDVNDDFHLGLEGGHHNRRIFHIHDKSGFAIHQCLLQKSLEHPNIHIMENACAIDILTSRKLKEEPGTDLIAYGAYILDRNKDEVISVFAKNTVLATGGAGKIYLYTSNWDGATGDGIAMAYRAGCRLANMEFMQFHPTCLYHPKARNFLITEALRGEGAKLVNEKGEEFAKDKHPMGHLAPRDIVARLIDDEIKTSGSNCVYLDISHKSGEWIEEHFPQVFNKCLEFDIDIRKEPIPVVPAAHYLCGGIWTKVNGQTDVKNLYAIGETAYTGLHGANRLASNSLLECVVQSKFCSEDINKKINDIEFFEPNIPQWKNPTKQDRDELSAINHMWDEIRNTMWNYVGIVRSNKRLDRAKQRLQYINQEVYEYYWDFKVHRDILELRNLALVAKLSIISAIKRKESRGCHYNIDYPNNVESFSQPTILNPNYR